MQEHEALTSTTLHLDSKAVERAKKIRAANPTLLTQEVGSMKTHEGSRIHDDKLGIGGYLTCTAM
jgi:hypothetical protein